MKNIILILLIISIICMLFTKIIVPKFFLEKHRVVYDLSNDSLHLNILKHIKKYTIYKVYGNQGDFDCFVLTFWCPKWQSKQILEDLKKFKEVEVI